MTQNQVVSSNRIAKSEEPDFTISFDQHIFRDNTATYLLTMTILRGDKWEVEFLHFDNITSASRMYQNIIGY